MVIPRNIKLEIEKIKAADDATGENTIKHKMIYNKFKVNVISGQGTTVDHVK